MAFRLSVVANARQRDYPWEHIATSLGVTPATARRRYRAHPPNPEPPLD